MVTEEEALIAGVDHDRVVGDRLVVEVVEQAPDVVVERRDHAQVVLDEALVPPPNLVVRRQAVGHRRLEIDDRVEIHEMHAHRSNDVGPAGVVVEDRVRLRDLDRRRTS